MFDGLIVKGALMAIGGGLGAVILGFIGWGIVQFVLAKYGKKNGKPTGDTINITTTISEEFAHLRKEFKEQIEEERELYKDQLKAEHMFISDVNKRLWSHVQDRTAHAGGG